MFAEISRTAPRMGLLTLLTLLSSAAALTAQEREIVSKEISVGRNEASLKLEFESGNALQLSFRDGAVHVNESELGRSSPELDAAWRALLSEIITLEDGALAAALRRWTPPPVLEGDAAELAGRLDRALEEALAASGEPSVSADPAGAVRERRALAALLGRRDRLAELVSAVEGLRSEADVRLYVAESLVVAAGERIDATVVLVDGEMVVRGVVDGDVVVVGGTVRLEQGGRIAGDLRMIDGRFDRNGGVLSGNVVEVDERESREVDEDTEERIRREVLREVRSELSDERGDASLVGRIFSPLRHVVRGIVGVISSLLTVLVLSLIGGVVLHFGRNNLEVVAETARRGPGRAAAVGLAGTFLALPVWVLGAVALTITIIGIPVAIVWALLFPVALALTAVLGYYAVARNVGAWIARRRYPYLAWVRLSNPYTLIGGGVLGLLGAFVVSNALRIAGPWLGFLRGLFLVGGILVTVAAVLIGLGAALITRAGRRPEYYAGTDFFDSRLDEDLGEPAGAEAI